MLIFTCTLLVVLNCLIFLLFSLLPLICPISNQILILLWKLFSTPLIHSLWFVVDLRPIFLRVDILKICSSFLIQSVTYSMNSKTFVWNVLPSLKPWWVVQNIITYLTFFKNKHTRFFKLELFKSFTIFMLFFFQFILNVVY